jgi:hypothetical protein
MFSVQQPPAGLIQQSCHKNDSEENACFFHAFEQLFRFKV